MINPTVGRVVWYWPGQVGDPGFGSGPQAAIVTHVWSDRMVNLAVFAPNGTHYSRTSVVLIQPGDDGAAPGRPYCAWMPYQLGQAAKTDAAEGGLMDRVKALEDALVRLAGVAT